MAAAFPDRCISYLNKQKGARNLRIHDYSRLLFDEHLHCFHSSISINGKQFHGIGTDRNMEVAASKCTAELIERILANRVHENQPSRIFACGTAFHQDRTSAFRSSRNELLERATLSACLHADSDLVTVKSHALQAKELPFLRSRLSRTVRATLTELLFFKSTPVFFVEITSCTNPALSGNGAACHPGSRKNGIEKALLEAYRRYTFAEKTRPSKIPLLRALLERPRKTIFPQFGRIASGPLPRPKARYAQIQGLGSFALMYLHAIPRLHPTLSRYQNMKSWYNLTNVEWADMTRSARILA